MLILALIQHAIKHNQTLMYINEHQKCIINKEKDHSLSLQSQLLQVKSLLQKKPDETSQHQYQQEILSLNQKLERIKAERENASEETRESKAKCEKVFQMLQNTHQLLERQIEIVEINKKNSSQQKLVIDQQQKELAEVRGELQDVKAKITAQKVQHREEVEEWRQKNTQLQEEFDKVMREMSEEKKKCSNLEDLNTAWSNQNNHLTDQLQSAKELLNKSKQEQTQQTEASWMNMVEQESQVEVICADISVQTNSVQHKTVCSQTPAPDLRVSTTQTRDPALANNSTQTDRIVLRSVSMQAEIIEYKSKERLFCKSLSSTNSPHQVLGQQSLESRTVQSISTDCSQSTSLAASTISCQPLQDLQPQSTNQPESQSITSQTSSTDNSQLPHAESWNVSDDTSQLMTVAVNCQQMTEGQPNSNTQLKNDIKGSQPKCQYGGGRHSFQFLDNIQMVNETVTVSDGQSYNEPDSQGKSIISKNEDCANITDSHRTADATDCQPNTSCEKIVSADTSEPQVDTKIVRSTGNLLKSQSNKIESYKTDVQKIDSYKTDMQKIDSYKTNVQASILTYSQTKTIECDPALSECDHHDKNGETNDLDKTCESPKSPGGSRRSLSLSKLKNLSPTNVAWADPSVSSLFDQDMVVVNPKSDPQKDELDHQFHDVKGILKDIGQENISKKKSVTFNSSLDVHQYSQTSVGGAGHDDGDRDLFSDDEADGEDKCSKDGAYGSVKDKCLPVTTLTIGKNKVESANTFASYVDDFLPDTHPSLCRIISTEAVGAGDSDLQMPAETRFSQDEKMKCRKSSISINTPCDSGDGFSRLSSRGTISVSTSNRIFPVLEIPSVPEMTPTPATLSNQYKRTIDAILNKGKKLKTDH